MRHSAGHTEKKMKEKGSHQGGEAAFYMATSEIFFLLSVNGTKM
jgi:hypothetical protein